MEFKLSEHIKTLRKERKMTQEQLAEALGVTVGAVHKWEKGLSTPDVGLILELADFFGVSTDALLGFRFRAGGPDAVIVRLKELAKDKQYQEAAAQAEAAIQKYPNHFAVVYQSGCLYEAWGEAERNREAYERAIPLLEHACALLSQNTKETVSEVSIRTQIGTCHLMTGNTDEALNTLKKYNVCGVNNALIGMVLGDYLHDADGAEKYLGKAFAAFSDDINSIMVGYANVFFQRKNYDAVIECFLWLRTVLRGIQPQSELTWFDKYDCVILETIAECYCFKGEFETARSYLKDAVTKAVRYDLAAPGEITDMKFFTTLNMEKQPNYDLYGKTAMDCLTRRIQPEDEGVPQLWKLWLAVKQEVLTNETV